MTYWPFWLVGLGLAVVPLVHWFWLKKMFAVSGRFTSVVDATLAPRAEEEEPLSQEDLIAAMRDATMVAFGEGVVGASVPVAQVAPQTTTKTVDHALFFLALAGGGAIARFASGAPQPSGAGLDPGLSQLVGGSPLVAFSVMLVGGVLVGFGTRMAGGCTSGHGLCGTSRVQGGSLAATACFFGAGIAVSFLLGHFMGGALMRTRLGIILVGLGFGAVLERSGFTSWDEIHKMFTFADLRLLLGFMSAVVVLFFAWRIIAARSNPTWAPRLLHRGVVPGSLMFGTGWALCGACPAIALVQLGEGRWLAGATLLGILVGNGLYPVAHRRWFRWSARSCADN